MSSLRNFGIALLISLLIFSGVAYFAMGVVADLFAPDEEANVDKGNQNVETMMTPSEKTIRTPSKQAVPLTFW